MANRNSIYFIWLTPFAVISIVGALTGVYLAYADLAHPSKMTPMGAYIGFGLLLICALLWSINYILCRGLPEHYAIIWISELVLLALVAAGLYWFVVGH